MEDFSTMGTLYLKKSYHDSVPSHMRPNELWTCPDNGAARAQAHRCQRNSWGPFEQEDEGINVTSDIVKVQGEDPDTPGYLRGGRARLGRRRSRIVGASPLARSRWSPWTVHNDSPILVYKKKQHTHLARFDCAIMLTKLREAHAGEFSI